MLQNFLGGAPVDRVRPASDPLLRTHHTEVRPNGVIVFLGERLEAGQVEVFFSRTEAPRPSRVKLLVLGEQSEP